VKRLSPLLLVLLAAGLFAATVLADSTRPGDTTTSTTTTGSTTTTASTTTAVPGLVPDGVTLAGVAIGGLASDAAALAVTDSFDRPVTLRFETTKIVVSPSLLGVSVPVESAVAKALTVQPGTTLALRATVNKLLIRSFIANIAKRFDRQPVSSRLLLRNSKPLVTKPVIGRKVDQATGVSDLSDALVHGTRATIILHAKLTQPALTPSKIGPVIVIRRGSNRLTLYNGAKVVRQFEVATGQTIYPTPLGKFQIIVKWENPWWYPPDSPWAKGEKPVPPGPGNPLGTRWMGLSSPGVGIHGTPEDGSIGYSLSHGCIRMHIPQAEWLFNHVNVGTPVYIVAS
jgi:lipoprotein-anchoring transpeptidase ErfK/SrfK